MMCIAVTMLLMVSSATRKTSKLWILKLRNVQIVKCFNLTMTWFVTSPSMVTRSPQSTSKRLKNSSTPSSHSCPFLAKAIDFYCRELSIDEWNEDNQDTHFLGSNMRHELGALLFTETISHSLNSSSRRLSVTLSTITVNRFCSLYWWKVSCWSNYTWDHHQKALSSLYHRR